MTRTDIVRWDYNVKLAESIYQYISNIANFYNIINKLYLSMVNVKFDCTIKSYHLNFK